MNSLKVPENQTCSTGCFLYVYLYESIFVTDIGGTGQPIVRVMLAKEAGLGQEFSA